MTNTRGAGIRTRNTRFFGDCARDKTPREAYRARMGIGARFVIFVLGEISRELTMQIAIRVIPGLAEAPTWVLVTLNVVSIGLILLMVFMPHRWWVQVREALAWSTPNGWKVAGIALAVIALVQAAAINWDSISSVYGSILEGVRRTHDISHLLTRPVCKSGDCPNFDFKVRDCERLAADVGGLSAPPRRNRDERIAFNPDVDGATEYLRGCLINQGLSWEPCDRGEPNCRLLGPYLGSTLPSFTVN